MNYRLDNLLLNIYFGFNSDSFDKLRKVFMFRACCRDDMPDAIRGTKGKPNLKRK